MNTTGTRWTHHLFLFAGVLLAAAVLGGCKSLETRLQEAETEGRLAEAFRLAVEYYDDNTDEPEAKADVALERVGNAYLSYLIQSAQTALSRENFTDALSLLYDHPANSAVSVLRTAEARGVQLAKRTVPEMMRSGVMAALEEYYYRGVDIFNRGDYHAALAHFKKMRGLKDADRYIRDAQAEVDYGEATALFDNGNYRKAYELFGRLGGFRDAAQMQAESLKRGKIVVAIFGFSGDHADIIREHISRRLDNDIFIDIVNADNLSRYSRITPDIARNTHVKYIISGRADLGFSTPSSELLEPDVQQAWVVTGDYYEIVDTANGKKRYVREAGPLHFTKHRLWYDGSLRLNIEMADAYDGRTLYSDVVYSETRDETVEWHYKGRYSPSKFTVRNPELDTVSYSETGPWYPSREDRCFQEYFTEQKPLIAPEVMAATLLEAAADRTARMVEKAIYRLENESLLSSK